MAIGFAYGGTITIHRFVKKPLTDDEKHELNQLNIILNNLQGHLDHGKKLSDRWYALKVRDNASDKAC